MGLFLLLKSQRAKGLSNRNFVLEPVKERKMKLQLKKIDRSSTDAGLAIPDLRVAAVLVFAILNLAVFLVRFISVLRYGALFPATGGERLAIYPVWKAVHHLPVYEWPLQFPFALALYNYLFYFTYAFYLKLAGAWGADILLWGRLFTPAFAVIGALAQWKLVQTHLHLRGVRSLLSLLFSLGLWFCASIVRQWAITIRPDMAAVALVMVALYMVVRQPRFGFVYAGVFFYLAWSFKQSVVLALAGVSLFLLFHKRWRDLSLLVAVFALLAAATILTRDPRVPLQRFCRSGACEGIQLPACSPYRSQIPDCERLLDSRARRAAAGGGRAPG